jgi:hypothetical protein
MLEIIALIFLSRKIGDTAIEKNLKPSKWKLIFVLSWIAAELAGAFIGYIIFQSIFPSMIVGIGCAISVYFIIKTYLQKQPNNDLYDIENIGNN